MRFGKKGKLNTRLIGPFKILERVGAMSYRIALPPNLVAPFTTCSTCQIQRAKGAFCSSTHYRGPEGFPQSTCKSEKCEKES